MTRFITKRILTSSAVMLTITIVTFVLARVVPSNPAVVYAGPKATQETLDRIQRDLGLDDPIVVQLVGYVTSVVRGDFGNSLASKQPVLPDLLAGTCW